MTNLEAQIKLTKFRYVGVSIPTDVASFESKISATDPYLQYFKREIPHNPERIAEIEAIKTSVKEFIADRFNLDVSDRLPKNHEIHFLSPSEWKGFLKKYKGNNKLTGGVASFEGHIYLKENAERRQLLHDLQHEVIHQISMKTIHSKNGIINGHLLGYQQGNNDSFRLLNEGITEMMNVDIEVNKWPSNPILKNINFEGALNMTYIPYMIMVEELAKKASFAHGTSFHKSIDDLYRGMITGDFRPIRMLFETIGRDNLKRIADLKYEPFGKTDSLLALFREIGLKAASRKIMALGRSPSHINVLGHVADIRLHFTPKPSRFTPLKRLFNRT